jgi:tetratricopeptide (TPR) repeat protein
MIEPYASCPCGSGKKFKWCCQAIYAPIQQAEEQFQAGQHEAALRAIEKIIERSPGLPHVWGKKAEFHASMGQIDAAEEALEKAFSIDSSYGFGLLLRARIRFEEGEVQGGLLLARKAVEAYSPEAREDLALLHKMIFQAEWEFRRPVAARQALETALVLDPTDEHARNVVSSLFAPQSGLPEAAWRKYSLISPDARRLASHKQALSEAPARLSGVISAFTKLTQDDPEDAAAWYNLGLARAWMGDNRAALEALDQYIERAASDADAAEAAALAEVLRCGQGMDDLCDHVHHTITVQIRDPRPLQALLNEWMSSHRLLPLEYEGQQESQLHALLIDLNTSGLVTVGSAPADHGRLAGEVRIVPPVLNIICPIEELYSKVKEEVRTKLHLGLAEVRSARVAPSFAAINAEALTFFVGQQEDQQEAKKKVHENAARFFEDIWMKRPRKALSGITPADAVGSAKLRRKLTGIILFQEQCARIGGEPFYDFNQLRRKLGLAEGAPATAEAAADVQAMGPAELAALKPGEMDNGQLEMAFQAAHRLEASEIAGRFARELASRPAQEGTAADRLPYFGYLITQAIAEGDTEAALGLIDEGMRIDCESNEGRRRSDYESRRASVHVLRGEADLAEDVYSRIIQRTPRDFKVRGQAAEAMLRLKQPNKARRFAEEGAAEARKANDRDAEGYLNDLAGAAQRQGG